MLLIEPSNTDLATGRIYDMLQETRAENVWLANFSSDNTRDAYKRAVGSFIQTLGINTADELYQVTQAHVIAWREAMQQAGLSRASIATRLSALSSLYKHLTDERLAISNPVSGVKRPQTGNSGLGAGKSPTLSKQQVRAMLDAPDTETIKGLRDRALLHVFFFTGARCTEPTKLKVKDLRFDREYTVLHFTVKGNKTNTVAVHPECASAVKDYLDVSAHASDPEAYIFQAIINGKDGEPMTRRSFYNLFKKYGVLAGIPDTIYPHVARATLITHAFDNGVQGEAIQKTVGHASITTTEGYNHTSKKHRESASLAMKF